MQYNQANLKYLAPVQDDMTACFIILQNFKETWTVVQRAVAKTA